MNLHKRKEQRLKEIENLVKLYRRRLGITKEIRVKELEHKDISAEVGRNKLIDFIDFKREYLYVYQGLLEVDYLPSLYLQRLVAHELVHIYYCDNLVGSLRRDILLFPNSSKSNLKRLVILMIELRADIEAARLLKIKKKVNHQESHYYSTEGFDWCFYQAGYPDKETRIDISLKYERFTQKVIDDVLDIYIQVYKEIGVDLGVSKSSFDDYIKTLNKEWLSNWPKQ